MPAALQSLTKETMLGNPAAGQTELNQVWENFASEIIGCAKRTKVVGTTRTRDTRQRLQSVVRAQRSAQVLSPDTEYNPTLLRRIRIRDLHRADVRILKKIATREKCSLQEAFKHLRKELSRELESNNRRKSFEVEFNNANPRGMDKLFYTNRAAFYKVAQKMKRAPECPASARELEEAFTRRFEGTCSSKEQLIARGPFPNADRKCGIMDTILRQNVKVEDVLKMEVTRGGLARRSPVLSAYLKKYWKGVRDTTAGENRTNSTIRMDKKLSWKELKKAVNKLKRRKSPGPDGITNELWQDASPILKFRLYQILRKCLETGMTPASWSKGVIVLICKLKEEEWGDQSKISNIENYRPICLLNTAYKLFTAILNARLQKHLQKTGYIHTGQRGFQPGKNTMENVWILSQILDMAQRTNSYTVASFVDFRDAFTSVEHGVLEMALELAGASDNFQKLFCSIYSKASIQIRIGSGTTNPVPVGKGILQGCPLSPTLFVLGLEILLKWIELPTRCRETSIKANGEAWVHPGILIRQKQRDIEEVRINPLAFADDVALVQGQGKGSGRSHTSTNTLNAPRCHRAVVNELQWERVLHFATWAGMSVKPSKSGVMDLCSRNTPIHNRIQLIDDQGEVVPSVKSYKYLGVEQEDSRGVKELRKKLDKQVLAWCKESEPGTAALLRAEIIPTHFLAAIRDCITSKAAYWFPTGAIALQNAKTWDIARDNLLRKKIMGSSKANYLPKALIALPTKLGGLGLPYTEFNVRSGPTMFLAKIVLNPEEKVAHAVLDWTTEGYESTVNPNLADNKTFCWNLKTATNMNRVYVDADGLHQRAENKYLSNIAVESARLGIVIRKDENGVWGVWHEDKRIVKYSTLAAVVKNRQNNVLVEALEAKKWAGSWFGKIPAVLMKSKNAINLIHLNLPTTVVKFALRARLQALPTNAFKFYRMKMGTHAHCDHCLRERGVYVDEWPSHTLRSCPSWMGMRTRAHDDIVKAIKDFTMRNLNTDNWTILENTIPDNAKAEWQSRISAGHRNLLEGNRPDLIYTHTECRSMIIVEVTVCVEHSYISRKETKRAKYDWLIRYLESTGMDVTFITMPIGFLGGVNVKDGHQLLKTLDIGNTSQRAGDMQRIIQRKAIIASHKIWISRCMRMGTLNAPQTEVLE